MIDCLIIGFNDFDFATYAEMIRAMGEDSGAWRDLNLALLNLDGKPVHAMDVLDRFHREGRKEALPRFHNADFLWPVVTVLGSYLHRQGLSFDYVNLFQEGRQALGERLERQDIRTIAITTTLYVSPHPILEIIEFIRRHNTSARIVVGGPYIANQPRQSITGDTERLFRYIDADCYIISSEGEATLVRLIRALKGEGRIEDIPNLAFRNGARYTFTSIEKESNALAENPAAYELFSRDIGAFLSIRTAKSCPFACAFCGFPERAGRYKYLGVAEVEKELDRIRALGTVTTLTFLDDTFNVPPKRFREILHMMIRNRYPFRWNSFYRADHGDDETIELMARAGCEGVFLGVESGSDDILRLMNKSARRADYLHAIPKLREQGILTYASLIVGFPGETRATLQETVDLIETAQPDFYRAQLWYCDPITPIWERRAEHGIEGSGFQWSHATMTSTEACDHIDRMFLGVEGSIWLPQFGFEQWSTYYLQRRGMSLSRLKAFLRCFNASVKERLLFRDRQPPADALLRSLRQSCRFDEPAEPDMDPVQALSGSRYRAAEAYVAGLPDGQRRDTLVPTASGDELQAGEWVAGAATLRSACRSTGRPARAVLLSALGGLLLRLTGEEDLLLCAVSSRGGALEAVPLRLRVSFNQSFRALAQATQEAWEAALPFTALALPIALNPLRMATLDRACPSFRAALVLRNADDEDCPFARAQHLFPEVWERLPLILEAVDTPSSCAFRLWSRPAVRDGGSRDQVTRHLEHLLRAVGMDDLLTVGASPIESSVGMVRKDVTENLSAVFDFSSDTKEGIYGE